MKSAIIKTGGKQYFVTEGSIVKVEKLAKDVENTVEFTDVLLAATDKVTKVGTPLVTGAKVKAKIRKQDKTPKVFGVKMKPKKRHRRYFSHRQAYTELEITAITTSSAPRKQPTE